MKLCVTEPDVTKIGEMGRKQAINRDCSIEGKIWSLIFTELVL